MSKVSLLLTLSLVTLVLSDQLRLLQPSTPLDRFIVGGQITKIENYPHQAAVLSLNRFFCGGLIITSRWIITAAHCVHGRVIDPLTIRVGSSFSDDGGTIYEVISNIPHFEFSWITLDNDIAMLKTSEEIKFTESIQPIPINGINCGHSLTIDVNDGDFLTVTGFGETLEENVQDPTALRVVSVPKINQEECHQIYQSSQFPYPVTETMLCAALAEGGRDACNGDSGSAIFAEGQDERCAVGVVSWGIGCAQKGFPGVYARFSSAAPFIRKVLDLM